MERRGRGKGKNNKGTQRVSFIVSCTPEQRYEIKQKAESLGITISELIIKSVLK